MAPSASAPCFDGEGEFFASYAQVVELWRLVATLGLGGRALALFSNMDSVPQEVNDQIIDQAVGSDEMDPVSQDSVSYGG